MRHFFISKNKFALILSISFLMILWKMISFFLNNELILPSPESTFLSVLSIIKHETFHGTLKATIFRGITGFLISFSIALTCGCAAGNNKLIFYLLQPLTITIKTTPVLAIILLAIIWLNTELVPAFVCFLVVFPIIYSNVTEGINSVDIKLIEMAEIYKIKKLEKLKSIYLPSITSHLIAGTSTAIGLTWKAVIAAEVICQPFNALGTKMVEAKIDLDMPALFAWTAIAIILSSISEFILRILSKYLYWKKYVHKN